MEKNVVMGIDPSIRSTGVCVREDHNYIYYIIAADPTKKLQKFSHPKFGLLAYKQSPVKGKTSIGKEAAITDNIEAICDRIEKLILIYKPKRIVMEACAFAAGGRVADLSGLNHCIRLTVRHHNIPIYVIPPTTNKLEFVGNGQATKEMMIEAWKMVEPAAEELLSAGKIDDIADARALCDFPASKLTLE